MPDLDDLMAAVVSGNLPEVWSLLDAPGAAPAIFEGREAMALSMACMHAGPYNIEREGIVNALLRAGATPDLASLLHSINAGNVSVLKLLLDAGADAQAIGRHGWTALHSACRSSAVCVELLLAAGADSVVNLQSESRDGGPFYPLDLAVKNIVDNPGTRARLERALPLLLRAGAICPTPYYSGLPSGDPYLDKVRAAGGFRRYEQRHINALAATFGPKLGLLPEMARVVVAFYAHCGFY
jgi:ankyrin repeat protein